MKIALCGRKNSGKDTVAKFLNFYLNGGLGSTEEVSGEILYRILNINFKINRFRYLNIAFADKLKKIIGVMYSINPIYLHTQKKNTLFYNFYTHNLEATPSETSISARKLLQDTADKIKKGFGENYFVEDLLFTIRKANNVIVTDCRYINEYEALKKEEFYFIKVERDTEEVDPHSSENSVVNLSDDNFDFIIKNNSDINTLARSCYDLYCELVDYIRDSENKRGSKNKIEDSNPFRIPAIINDINDKILNKPIYTNKGTYYFKSSPDIFYYDNSGIYTKCCSATSSFWEGLV